MTPDASLANHALDGVLQIIGEPSPEEKVYAASLDILGCDAVTANATDTKAYRAKLLASESSAETALARDYHSYARSAGLLRTIKWFAFSAGAILIISTLIRRIP
jgi:glycerol-3-phosphate dehydrogenase